MPVSHPDRVYLKSHCQSHGRPWFFAQECAERKIKALFPECGARSAVCVGAGRLLGGERASVTLSCIHPPSPEPSVIPDGFHKHMRRLLWVHWFNEARMADSCNKYLIMLMKTVLKTSTTHSAVPRAAMGLITAQPRHLCFPQPLQVPALAFTKDLQTCACIVHCHPVTRARSSLKILLKSPTEVPQNEVFLSPTFPVQLFQRSLKG